MSRQPASFCKVATTWKPSISGIIRSRPSPVPSYQTAWTLAVRRSVFELLLPIFLDGVEHVQIGDLLFLCRPILEQELSRLHARIEKVWVARHIAIYGVRLGDGE